ncbi:beta strand repeat-containing protein, partial [Flavobacterium myungsuense]
MKTIFSNKKIVHVVFLALTLFFVESSFAQTTYYSRLTGGWNAAVWSTTVNGTATTATITSNDNVVIQDNHNITVNVANAVCKSISMGTSNAVATLTFAVSSQLTVSGAVTLGNSGDNNRRGAIVMAAGGKLICNSLALGNAGTNTFTSGTGTVELAATNTLPATIFTTFNNLIISTGKTTTGRALTITSLTVNSADEFELAHAVTANALSLEGGCAVTGAIVSGSSTLTLGGNVTVTDNTGGTAGAVISCPVALSATRTFTVADDGTSANDLTISSVISGTAFGITKAGAGTLFLSGLNTYTGAVTVSAGTLLANTIANASTTSSLGTGAGTAAISIGASGTLAYSGSGNTSSRAITLTGSGATINASGTGALTLSGGITGNTFNLILTGTGNATQSGVINTTTGTVTKNGTGTWVLSGTNTFTGATNVNAGTLNIQNAQGTGTTAGGVTVASGATLQLQGAITVGAEALSLAGGGVDGNAAFDNVSGNNSWGGAITLAADATVRNQLNNLTISGTVALAGRQLTLGGASTGGSISGVISGSGSAVSAIRKVTSGTWSLSGANTYTGNILIQSGTLTVGNASALGANTNNLSISSGAVANLSSSETVASLTLDVLGTQNGTWGSGSSSATFKDDIYFTSTGILTFSNDTRTTPTVTPTIGSYTFSGSAQGPNTATNTGTATSYTYSYEGTGGTTYAASATAPTNAGTYTVTATVAANRNYLSASSSATAFTIGVATPTVTVTVGTYTFSGSPQGPNAATNTGTGTSYTYSYVGTGGTTYTASAIRPTNVGSYTVTATVAANGNFGSASSTATAFTIGVATPTVTVTVGTYTFSGSPQGPNEATNTGTGTSYTYSYVGTGGTTYTASATRPTNVGTYTVTATVAANGNFGAASSTATAFTIGLATPTITPTIGTYTYTRTVQGPNAATNTGTGTSYTFSYAGVNPTVYGPSATRPINVGSYTVTVSVAANGNFAAATSSPTAFTINSIALTITGVTVSNKIYDNTTTASLNTASATLVGVLSPDVVTLNSASASGTFASENAGAGIAVTTSGFSIGGANSGNYTLTQPTGLTSTISPRPVTLSGTRVYDNTDVAAATDLTITNNLDGANLTLSGSGSISLEDVGTHSISVASLPARVQFATANTGGNPATSCIATFSATPTNGNTLIAVITTRNNAANTVSSITQTGATWTRATQGVNTNGTTTEIWFAPARTTVGASVTVTLNQVSTRTSLVVMEYSGILALNPLDVVNNSTGNSATATTNTITTTQANELLIAGVGLVNSTFTLNSITNSFTTVANVATTNGTSSNNAETYALERIVNTAGTYSTGGTVSTSSQWSAAIASFKAVIPSGNAFVLGGSAASNYTLNGVSGSMEITPKNLTISGVFATNKVYDGTTVATLNSDLASLSGVISSDAVSLNSSNATGTFASANVGTGIAVTASGFSLTGANAGNYSVTQPTGLSANITSKGITIYANNRNKCLGSTLTFAGNEFTTSSQESGLTISGVTLTSTGATSSAALGTYTIAASNATGTGLGNYAINYVSGTLTVMSSPATTGASICPGGSGALTSSVSCISASILGGVKNPGAVVNTSSIGNVAWSNPSNAMTNNGAYASVTLSNSSQVSNYLMSANHSFAIPTNAIIQGITVVIQKYATNFIGFTRFRDNEVRLVKAGTVVGDNNANAGQDWPQTAQDFTYGSVNDLWGTTWTAADINNANFGVALSALSATNPFIPIPYSGEVDAITIEVIYGLPGTLNWFTASSGGSAIGSGSSFNPVGVAGSPLANTNTPGTTTFFAECSSLPGCRTATDFVITANPTAPTAINNTKTYTGIANTTSISATPQANQTIDWYQDATGGSPLVSGSTTYIPTAVNVGTYTFYAAARANSLGCTSTTRTAVTLTITKAPLTITANNQSVSFKTAVATVIGAGTYTASGFVNGETAAVISGTVTYTTTYTATTNAGTSGVTITPNVSGLTATNYSFGTIANGTITIGNATPIVTPIIGSYIYTGVPQGPNSATNTGTGATYTYSYVGVSGTAYNASATPPTAVGSYSVTATVAADGNYSAASSVPTAFTIGKAVLTITANNQAVSFGVAVASVTGAGTYTATGFVNGETASVISGAATYTTTYTTTTALGTAGVTITPNVTGLSAANYSFVGANGTIAINNKITPTLSVTIASYTYTGLPQGPNTATNSGTGSTYTYSYSGSGSTVYGPSATLPTVAGSYTVKVAVAASIDGVYNSVTSAETAFTINKATLTLTASNANKTYGTVITTPISGSTAYTITSGSLKNGETIGSVTLTHGVGALAATDAVGSTSIITPSAATGGTFSINNYTITYNTGTLTVTPLAITVTATGPAKIYGTALTTGTSTSNFTVTGTLPSGQALTSVTLTPNANGLSATTAAGAAYTVTPSLATGSGGFIASNYSITYVAFSGVVATKALTITANPVSKVYGEVLTTPETGSTLFTTSGLVGSETVGTVTLNYGSGASAISIVGTYASAVVPSAAIGGTFNASNYTITYVGGTTTVTTAALTVTAQDQSKCFGANVVFFGDEFLTAGLKNADDVTTVSLSSTASSTATVAGTYDIVPSAATGTGLSNYTITYVNGTFTVISSPAPSLSVTPATATVCSGTPVAITATVSGGSPNKVYTGVNTRRVNIPTNSSNSVSQFGESTIDLTDATSATVSSASVISVQFSITHTNVQELDVYLVDPSGTRGMLLTANNGGNGDNYTNTIISTSATNKIGSSGNNSAPFTNTYAPEGGISTEPATNTQNGNNSGSYSTANIGSLALNGATINGTWSIKVFDVDGSTTGRLDNWTLTITNPGVYTSTLVGPEANETITYSGTNNRNVAISMTPPAGVNNYYVETTDAIGCSNISSAIATTVNTAPAITVQPTAPAAVCSGNGIRTISVTATGAGLTYSWRRAGVALTNGGVISGQGTATLTLTNPLAANAGSYDVVISGTCTPTATSNPVTLTVNPNLPASVSIVSNDADNTICAGTSVSFNATPVNGGTPSYQWRLNGTNVGTNSATYTTSDLVNNAAVSVLLTSTATCATGSPATSNTITTTVNPNLPASVSVASSDADNAICPGTSVTFTATPTNGGTLPSYQWRLNGTTIGTNSATFTTTTLANNDVVTVVMTSNATPCLTGSPVTSNSITTLVNPNVVASVSISSSDADNSICSGSSVSFTATPTNGGSSPIYLWRLNGINVGTNSATYTTVALTNNDQINVIMTSNASCASGSPATSNTITTVVNPNLPASVSIVSNDADNSICSGASVTFTATPTNGGTPSYQWKLNGANVGTNSLSYTTTALVNNDSVSVVMTSTATCTSGSPATSNTITTVVNPNLPASVSVGASATTICPGTSVTFTATPTNGGTAPSYQWKLNGS